MITFQSAYQKAVFISGDTNASTLVQFKQDINIGYKRFNAAIARYFTRKQQFTNAIANQKYYQTPVDSIRVEAVSVVVTAAYEYPLIQVRSEEDWRLMNTVTGYASNLPTHYFVYGNDQIGIFPITSQTVIAGIRFVYQPQDVDLTADDYITGTATVSNGGVAVAGTGTTWSTNMIGRQFQVTDGSDGNWYEITAVTSTTALTIKTPYVGLSVTNATYLIGQVFIFPGEYDDVPVDYALSRFFEFSNNPTRAQYHLNKYTSAVEDAIRRYASSSTSNVITGEDDILIAPGNPWLWNPTVGA